MKKFLFGALALLFVWLMAYHVAKSQDRAPWQIGVFGGIMAQSLVILKTDNASDWATAWMGVGGVRQ